VLDLNFQVRLERHGNTAKISLDASAEEQGSAPGANDVLNLGSVEPSVYFGAEVTEEGKVVQRGFAGCVDDVRVDGVALPTHLGGESQV
jgi:protocadherin Fat 1/2/3